MQSAGEPNPGRRMAAPSRRGTATNRTLVWFSGDAERRRRAAAAAQEASSPPAAAGVSPPAARAWQRPELLGCVAVTGLALAMIGWPSFNAGIRPCWTEPAVLAPGARLDVRMAVSHNAACSVWSKVNAGSIGDVRIAVPPQHGTLALRGRSGVTYRPAPGFTGRDFFDFSLGATSPVRGEASLVHVDVTVR
jgi:hypothetical protein